MVTFQNTDCQGNTLTTHAEPSIKPKEILYKAYAPSETTTRPNRAVRRKQNQEEFKKFYRSFCGSY